MEVLNAWTRWSNRDTSKHFYIFHEVHDYLKKRYCGALLLASSTYKTATIVTSYTNKNWMANLTSTSYSRVVISPSLLESLTIHHPVPPCFRIGMDEWVNEYMKSIEGSPSLAHSTQPFSKEDENHIWKQGVLGTGSPHALFRAMFFNNDKNFCLRGSEEHRSLKHSQLKKTPHGYVYTENAPKNWQVGLGQVRLKNKCVEIWANEDAGERCYCSLLDMYLSKLPNEV